MLPVCGALYSRTFGGTSGRTPRVEESGMHGFSDVDAYDARRYIAYLDAVTERSRKGKTALFKIQGIREGSHVLDAGCGTGDDVRAIAQIVGETGRSAGIDASEAMVAEAHRRGLPRNAEVAQARCEALPFADASFDACRAERLLQHTADAAASAAELHRVLKPGGTLLAVDQDWETVAIAGADRTLTRRIVRAFVDGLADGWAGRRHIALFRRAGFTEVATVPGTTVLPFAPAYAFVLESAIDRARASGAVTEEETTHWLRQLTEADRRGEFFYCVTTFVTLARR